MDVLSPSPLQLTVHDRGVAETSIAMPGYATPGLPVWLQAAVLDGAGQESEVVPLTIASPVPTDHCGDIASDRTWSPGLHHVSCNVLVSSLSTLEVADGARVTFAPGTKLRVSGGSRAGTTVRLSWTPR